MTIFGWCGSLLEQCPFQTILVNLLFISFSVHNIYLSKKFKNIIPEGEPDNCPGACTNLRGVPVLGNYSITFASLFKYIENKL